jgi:hypothetical protein
LQAKRVRTWDAVGTAETALGTGDIAGLARAGCGYILLKCAGTEGWRADKTEIRCGVSVQSPIVRDNLIYKADKAFSYRLISEDINGV